MSNCCCSCASKKTSSNPKFRKALWIALFVNALMFCVEIFGGLRSGSVSLLADAIDFAGDSANYALSLAALSMGLIWHSRAALLKGATMGAYGVFVLAKTGWAIASGLPPEPFVMGGVALLALAANVGVAAILYAFREGDANSRSVWLCSRNDAIVNLAIVLAAIGVFGSGTIWPDIAVAGLIAVLAIHASVSVVRQACAEIRELRSH